MFLRKRERYLFGTEGVLCIIIYIERYRSGVRRLSLSGLVVDRRDRSDPDPCCGCGCYCWRSQLSRRCGASRSRRQRLRLSGCQAAGQAAAMWLCRTRSASEPTAPTRPGLHPQLRRPHVQPTEAVRRHRHRRRRRQQGPGHRHISRRCHRARHQRGHLKHNFAAPEYLHVAAGIIIIIIPRRQQEQQPPAWPWGGGLWSCRSSATNSSSSGAKSRPRCTGTGSATWTTTADGDLLTGCSSFCSANRLRVGWWARGCHSHRCHGNG